MESRPEYKVITAEDPVFGFPIARVEKPDLIILDVIMPFQDGFTAAMQFKECPELADMPIIMLTSFSSRKGEASISVAHGMDIEAEDYIEKPARPQDLLQMVDRFLKKQYKRAD